MKEKDVIAFRGTDADIQGSRESEIARKAAEPCIWKFVSETGSTISRTVIDNQDLMVITQSSKRFAQVVHAIERDDYNRDFGGLYLIWFQMPPCLTRQRASRLSRTGDYRFPCAMSGKRGSRMRLLPSHRGQ